MHTPLRAGLQHGISTGAPLLALAPCAQFSTRAPSQQRALQCVHRTLSGEARLSHPGGSDLPTDIQSCASGVACICKLNISCPDLLRHKSEPRWLKHHENGTDIFHLFYLTLFCFGRGV